MASVIDHRIHTITQPVKTLPQRHTEKALCTGGQVSNCLYFQTPKCAGDADVAAFARIVGAQICTSHLFYSHKLRKAREAKTEKLL